MAGYCEFCPAVRGACCVCGSGPGGPLPEQPAVEAGSVWLSAAGGRFVVGLGDWGPGWVGVTRVDDGSHALYRWPVSAVLQCRRVA